MIILALLIGSYSFVISNSNNILEEDIKTFDAKLTDRETWLQCIDDIQTHTMRSLSDILTRPELHRTTNPSTLFIDPAYHGESSPEVLQSVLCTYRSRCIKLF